MICVDTTYLIDLWHHRHLKDHPTVALQRYAVVVSNLRARSLLQGASKPDLWIAAWALEHGARLATRNRKHFENVPDLHLILY